MREAIGKPSVDEINEMMTREYPKVVKNAYDCVSNQQQLLAFSLRLKSEISQRNGVAPSRRSLCVGVLRYKISDNLKRSFTDALMRNDIPSFRFYFDMDEGFKGLLGFILTTEKLTREDIETVVQKEIASISQDPEAPEASEEERYMAVKDYIEGNVKLLSEDPTGFLLLDTLFTRMKQNKSLFPSDETPEYSLAGAKLAVDLYKWVYEATGSLYPSSPQQSPQ